MKRERELKINPTGDGDDPDTGEVGVTTETELRKLIDEYIAPWIVIVVIFSVACLRSEARNALFWLIHRNRCT